MGTFSDLVANSWLDAVCRNTAYAEAAVYVQLHLGDPGSAGTANPAANTTRQAATFGTGATGRAISNTAAVEWTSVPNTETYTWISLWDASHVRELPRPRRPLELGRGDGRRHFQDPDRRSRPDRDMSGEPAARRQLPAPPPPPSARSTGSPGAANRRERTLQELVLRWTATSPTSRRNAGRPATSCA